MQAKQEENQSWDAIVIGSGMGGMSCSAALSHSGLKVLLLEQHYVAGGFTHAFSRKGFQWDVGVHCVGEMGPDELPGELFRWLCEGKVQMNSMGSIYETFFFPDQYKVTFPNSSEQFRSELEAKFPKEKKAIDRYFKLIRKVSEHAKIFFALRAMPEWVDQLASKTLFKFAKKYWRETTEEVLDQLTSDSKLKAVLTAQWGYYGSTPEKSSFAIHALTVRHFWNGGYYPENGAQTIAESLLGVVERAGGKALLRTSVDQILVKDGKARGVKTQSGEEYFAPHIVSAVGAKTTVQSLLPLEYRNSDWGKTVVAIGHSPSYICLNLGFEGDILTAGATVSNQWFFESWSMKASEWDLEDPDSIAPIIYLSFPSLKDPKHDPGEKIKNTGEAVTFVPWGAFEKWKNTRRGKRDPDYHEFKKQIEQRFIAQLKKHIPKVMEKVVYHELSTPLSTRFFTRASQGAIYGLEATPDRFLSTGLRTRTPVRNLYLAGGDVATLGVTGAMVGGVLAAATIRPRIFQRLL